MTEKEKWVETPSRYPLNIQVGGVQKIKNGLKHQGVTL
jgi:hypothetical protein